MKTPVEARRVEIHPYIKLGLLIFIATLGLLLAAFMEHSPSTIPFLHLSRLFHALQDVSAMLFFCYHP